MRSAPLIALALVLACPSPEKDREALTARRVAEVLELYHAWDDALAIEVFGDRPPTIEGWRATLEWLRPRLGACGPAEPIEARRRGSEGRFRSACERGALEIEPWIRDGVIQSARFGGRGIDAAEAVQAAAEAVVAAMPLDDAALDRWPADRDFIDDFAIGLGRCALAGTDIVDDDGGIFYLDCEGGPARLKVGVDRTGAIERLRLFRPHAELFNFGGRHGV